MKLSQGNQNCGQFSNISTKRSGNISRESTSRRAMFSNQSSCFSSPKNINHIKFEATNSSYSKIHLKKNIIEQQEIKQIREDNPSQFMTQSAIKIQRFWRFHLLMRRKAQTKIILNLTNDTKIWQLNLHHCKLQQSILEMRLKNIYKSADEQASSELVHMKQMMKQYTQSSIKKEIQLMKTIAKIRKQIQYYNKTTSTIKDSVEQYEQMIKKLLKKQHYFKDRQEGHIMKINRLNKDLVLLNMEKSRMQLQVDQLRCQLREEELNQDQN